MWTTRLARGTLRGPSETGRLRRERKTTGGRGGALLAVMWLAAALSAIAFSLATTVRGETERAATGMEGVRGYYLAEGGVERAILYVLWGPQYSLPGGGRYFTRGQPFLHFDFPEGETFVQVIPEASKLNVNNVSPELLMRLLLAIGVEPARAETIVMAVLDWRAKPTEGGTTPYDQYYLSLTPSFPSRHASFQQIEELLVLKGMTPEIYYGSYDRDAEGHLLPRPGLRDCLSVYGSAGGVDVNTATPAVLAAVGVNPAAIDAIVQRRRIRPFLSMDELAPLAEGNAKLGLGGNSIFTLRSTGRIRLQNGQLSDMKRSVAAMVKFLPSGYNRPFDILRWYDNEWVQ